MSDPRTTLNARLLQAHGLAYTLSDMSGDAMCPDAIRTAFYGLAELIGQAQEAFERDVPASASARPVAKVGPSPVFDEEGYYRALSSLEVLHAYLVNEDKPVDSARLSFVIDGAVKELQRSVII